MLYEFDNDWIETKDPKELSIKEKRFFETQKYTKLLQSYILDWSINQKITEKTIKKIKYRYMSFIIRDIGREIERFDKNVLKEEKIITKIFYLRFKGAKVIKHGENFWEYLDDLIFEIPYYFDHRGNIIHLPKTAGIEDQEWEKMKIITMAQNGLKEVLKEQNNAT
ncbi:Putative tail assembly chaperone protein [Marinitoga phage MPV1]|uniref:Uncharacterized protein n=1 Tax=Marinitoga piezophila (strain DSM 14283 / JCM 11233 / KA3) TaxID=443254 RepID=H2J4C8_MARPK|nr:hypothetical protein [Marinitoga piezophila]AEX84783.1 hypothetical protein Marpi_0333 [Marinitoga piezophila KA3]